MYIPSRDAQHGVYGVLATACLMRTADVTCVCLDGGRAQNLGTDYDERVLPSIGNEVVKAVVVRRSRSLTPPALRPTVSMSHTHQAPESFLHLHSMNGGNGGVQHRLYLNTQHLVCVSE